MYQRLNEIIEQQINNLNTLKESGYTEIVSKVVDEIVNSLKKGNKVLIAGNGGSAADAQHFAGEFVGRFLMERKAIPAISLTTDTSVLTCVGNDYGYDATISRQVEALGKEGDVFIGISTSGNSVNIMSAVESAKKIGMISVGLLGKTGGALAPMCDLSIVVPFKETPRIQEVHTMTVHMICEMVEKQMFEEE